MGYAIRSSRMKEARNETPNAHPDHGSCVLDRRSSDAARASAHGVALLGRERRVGELAKEVKREMTVKRLKEFIKEIPDDYLVHVIFRGIIDQQPVLYVDDKVLYVEGM